MPAWPIALATLPVGFAVAELTGSRPAGGVALLAGGAATLAVAQAPKSFSAIWGGVAFASFAASHLLAGPLGSWGAVAAAGAVTGVAGWALLDR